MKTLCVIVASLLVSGAFVATSAASEVDEGLSLARAQSDPQGVALGLIIGIDRPVSARSHDVWMAPLRIQSDIPIGRFQHDFLPDVSVVHFTQPVDAAIAMKTARELEKSPGVAWVELDIPIYSTSSVTVPNDPQFDQQWHLWDPTARQNNSIDAPLGWPITTGSKDVVVAVIDSGWTQHPDLPQHHVNGYDFVSNPLRANDGDGPDADARDPGDWVSRDDQSRGFSNCRVENSSWHGTHVAGIVGAAQNNRVGVSGVAPGVTVVSVRALGKCGGTVSDIARAIRWSAGENLSGFPRNPNPANVINLSLGGAGQCSSVLGGAVEYAIRRGVTVVASAGNEGRPVSSSTPANCPGVISVVATNPDGLRTRWSNYGTSDRAVSIAAPGESVLSTYNAGRQRPTTANYQRTSGTSMAAPMVAGAVALLYSLGVKSADIPSSLSRLTKSFPTRGSGIACNRTSCGPGLLSLEKLSLFGSAPSNPTPPPPQPPETEAPEGPQLLSSPGLIEGVSVTYQRAGQVSNAQVRWTNTRGGTRSLYFEYRVQLHGTRWTGWQRQVASRLNIQRVPRGNLSYVEIRGVNEMGRGAVYQVALAPR